jgi:hypothetical protein
MKNYQIPEWIIDRIIKDQQEFVDAMEDCNHSENICICTWKITLESLKRIRSSGDPFYAHDDNRLWVVN